MVLFIISLILSILALGYVVFKIKKYSKTSGDKDKFSLSRKEIILMISISVLVGITTVLSSLGLGLKNSWNFNGKDYLLVILGSFFLGTFSSLTIIAFGMHYYFKNIKDKLKKFTKMSFIITFVLTLLGLFLFSEGIANQDIYPLVNRIDIVYGLTRYGEEKSNFGIQFYGIIIVCGALVCYFITDHYTYKKFGEHGLIDTLFIVAFLAGVVGARLWYCLVLEPKNYLPEPVKIFTGIFDGGLAIQGGAIFGITFGVLFVLKFRKYIDVRFLMDVAIPTILIAQALGRWGNFFNLEVHGQEVSKAYFEWLPTIIKNNMQFSSVRGPAEVGNVYVPLFLIESVINFGGFFFIRFFLGKVCKFGIGKGYQAASYCVWYGLVRVFLEPLRVDKFKYNNSIITAYTMIGIGVVLFIFFYLFHKNRMKNGLEDSNGEKIKKS